MLLEGSDCVLHFLHALDGALRAKARRYSLLVVFRYLTAIIDLLDALLWHEVFVAADVGHLALSCTASNAPCLLRNGSLLGFTRESAGRHSFEKLAAHSARSLDRCDLFIHFIV